MITRLVNVLLWLMCCCEPLSILRNIYIILAKEPNTSHVAICTIHSPWHHWGTLAARCRIENHSHATTTIGYNCSDCFKVFIVHVGLKVWRFCLCGCDGLSNPWWELHCVWEKMMWKYLLWALGCFRLKHFFTVWLGPELWMDYHANAVLLIRKKSTASPLSSNL